MLTQEDFVAPNMSAERSRSLQRSSWKAEAIRRGDLKISGPIPITEETPLNEDEEREFAEKAPLSLRSEKRDPSPPAMAEPLPSAQPITENGGIRAVTDDVDDADMRPVSEVREDNHNLKHKSSSSSLREKNLVQSATSPPTVAYDIPIPSPPIQRSSTNANAKKRKGSIRNVFRKMFGRKSRDGAGEDAGSRHSHHRSEPITLLESPKMTREKIAGPRISDLPVRELEPINPLAQHLPFPMNVNAPQETSPPHDYLNFDTKREVLSRRRATLPSVLQTAAEGHDEEHDADEAQSPQIGIALSSPPQTTLSVQSKRRSRSAGALRDLAKARPSVERRRSAEIRYWRGSYQSGSVYSTATPRPQTARTIETVRIDMHDPAVVVSQIIATLEPPERPLASEHNLEIREATPPVEAFDFGDLKSDLADDELDDDEVDELAPPQKRLSIEERVKHLESNMHALETSVRRISGRTNRQTIILENAPKGRRSRSGGSPGSDWQGSHHSSASSRKTLASQHGGSGPSSPAAPNSSKDDSSLTIDQRKTIIGLDLDSILPPSTQHADLAQQLAIITAALKVERASRQALELQVDRLHREVKDLHAIVNKLASRSPSYPTPSPDTIILSHDEHERLSTPRAASHTTRGISMDPEDETPSNLKRIRETVISRFSQSDSELELGLESYSVTSSRDDITSPEAWATPKEESGFGSGFFGGNPSQSREVF